MTELDISGSGTTSTTSTTSTPSISGEKGWAKIVKQASAVKNALDGVARSLDVVTQKGSKAVSIFKGFGAGMGGSGNTAGVGGGNTHGHPVMDNSGKESTTSSKTRHAIDPEASGAGRGGAGRGGTMSPGMDRFVGAATAVGNFIGAGTAAMDSRIARGYAYSSSADKMSVMYQQITGLSNAGVRAAYRQPLTNYRLGENGINTLLGMQASTGIKALGQASTVEGINALSGYSLGAQGVTNMITNFGSAETANRMFMTSGMSLYKPGGGQRTGTEVIQNLAKASGLTGLKNIEGALQQGSNTRARLADMGIDSATQDIVIQYAMANKQYGAKGGKGMYDPSNKDQRRQVGIEDNFATQIEETTRVKTDREEDFYGRQQDNFAKLEKTTQSLERTFARLEDSLSGLIGKGIETKPKRKVVGGALKAIGPMMMMAGMALAATPAGPVLMGLGAVTSALGAATDGPNGDPGPSGRKLPSMGRTGDPGLGTGKLHPTMQKRVDNLIAASGGKVGMGQGYRSRAEQQAMFLSRYRKTSDPVDANGNKNWEWNNSYWEHVSGYEAAPPGRSMHELGLAADLTGDLDWADANASRFGLQHFADRGEKHHFQPSELPRGRTEYEKQGSPWGGGTMPTTPDSGSGSGSGSGSSWEEFGSWIRGEDAGQGDQAKLAASRVAGLRGWAGALGAAQMYGGSGSPPGATTSTFSGMSMADALAAFRAGGVGGSARIDEMRRRGSRSSAGVSTTPTKSGGQLSGEDVARYAYAAGFRGQNLVNVVGIAHRESRWNAGAYNPNAKTKDLSFGLMQINMMGYLGPARLKQFGLSNNEELYDPATNMRAAFEMSGGTNFHAWGGYKGKSNTYNTDLDMARQVVTNAGFSPTGDPDMRAMSRGGGGTSISTMTTGASFNIAPAIYLSGSANPHVDAQVIASEVTMIIEREMRMRSMRSA